MQQVLYSEKPGAYNSDSLLPEAVLATHVIELATHVIEPEFYRATPRSIVFRKKPVPESRLYVIYILGGLAFLLLFFVHPILVVHAFVALVTSCYFQTALYLAQQKHKKFLTNGLAKPALLIHTEYSDFSGRHEVKLAYEVSTGNYTTLSWTLPKGQRIPDYLTTGETFTVLVDPKNPTELIPYFAIGTCDIEGSSRIVKAKMAEPILLHNGVSAEPGVEAELYCAAPRRVIWTRTINGLRIFSANLLAGLAMLLVYLVRQDAHSMLYPGGPILFFMALLALAWTICECIVWKHRFLLKYGYAVRATVVQSKMDTAAGNLNLRIEYPKNKSEMAHDYLTIPVFRAKYLRGDMCVGTTFTVLRHPTEAFTILPYFDVQGVALSDATLVRVTPPIPTL